MEHVFLTLYGRDNVFLFFLKGGVGAGVTSRGFFPQSPPMKEHEIAEFQAIWGCFDCSLQLASGDINIKTKCRRHAFQNQSASRNCKVFQTHDIDSIQWPAAVQDLNYICSTIQNALYNIILYYILLLRHLFRFWLYIKWFLTCVSNQIKINPALCCSSVFCIVQAVCHGPLGENDGPSAPTFRKASGKLGMLTMFSRRWH